MTTSSSIHIEVPSNALQVIDVLEHAGFETWCVGGFVRDSILGRPIADVDIACNALWTQTKQICEAAGMRVHETGTQHGTVTVVCNDDAFEVTTFRIDGAYSDARHPNSVKFIRSIAEDLARRDFTINALAYHPTRGLLDPYGGLQDTRDHIIRTVGDAHKRFNEDALRILRACRFASQLGFSLEESTFRAMIINKVLLAKVSAERITAELEKFLLGEHVCSALLSTVDVLGAVLPELLVMKGFDQCTPYHAYDVLEHTARAVAATPAYPLVRWTALFHDIGKPAAFFKDDNGTGHFYGHAKISKMMAKGILDRLCFSAAFKSKVLTLVERHDDVFEATPKAVKRVLSRLGGSTELFYALCDMKYADAAAQAPTYAVGRMQHAQELKEVLGKVLAENEAFSLKQLAINGKDIMALGVAQGPAVGKLLQTILDAVIDEKLPNQREALLNYVKELKN